jgi:RimJ/RimL family protein N-acetyltransferase
VTFALHQLGAEQIRALHAGRADWAADRPELTGVVWPDEDRRTLRYRVEALDNDPDAAPYLLWVAVLDGRFAGRIGCHEAPSADGRVEVGYAVAAPERGHGLGGMIVDRFLGWLSAQGVAFVDASVAPSNEPSLRLLHRRGFVETGERWDDEDGRELVLTRQLGPRDSAEGPPGRAGQR